jgi:hypothetical protein
MTTRIRLFALLLGAGLTLAHPTWAAGPGGGEFYMTIPMHTIEVKTKEGHLRAITFEILIAFQSQEYLSVYSGQKARTIATIDGALRKHSYELLKQGNAAQIIKESAREAAQTLDPKTPVAEVLIKFLLVQ